MFGEQEPFFERDSLRPDIGIEAELGKVLFELGFFYERADVGKSLFTFG